jgi:hypothetical protein
LHCMMMIVSTPSCGEWGWWWRVRPQVFLYLRPQFPTYTHTGQDPRLTVHGRGWHGGPFLQWIQASKMGHHRLSLDSRSGLGITTQRTQAKRTHNHGRMTHNPCPFLSTIKNRDHVHDQNMPGALEAEALWRRRASAACLKQPALRFGHEPAVPLLIITFIP